jgi:hypothetical protein
MSKSEVETLLDELEQRAVSSSGDSPFSICDEIAVALWNAQRPRSGHNVDVARSIRRLAEILRRHPVELKEPVLLGILEHLFQDTWWRDEFAPWTLDEDLKRIYVEAVDLADRWLAMERRVPNTRDGSKQ